MVKTTTPMFKDVIGQDETKRKLEFYVEGYKHSRIIPNLMLCAQKGYGKSMFAVEVAKQLVAYGPDGKPLKKEDGKTDKKKKFYELTAPAISSLSSFVNGFLATKVVDRDVTVFIDEAHKLKKDVENGLLTMLANNAEHRTHFEMGETMIDLDFKRQTFIFATSESQSVFPPLMSRLKRIDLEPYSSEQLGQIVQKSAGNVKFKDGVIESICTVVRGNPRESVKMAEDIKTYLRAKVEFGKKQWRELCQILSIKPLGLSPVEISIMRFMQERPDGSSLTNLAARTGMSPEAIRRDYEHYLQYQGLMEITAGKGRTLTQKGALYLKELEAYELNLCLK